MSPLYIGLIIAGVGVLFVLVGLVLRSRTGKLAATPLMKTADAARASGPASCEGTTRAQQPTTAPCTGTPCVVFQLIIEKKIKTMNGNQQTTKWVNLCDPFISTSFALDDGSGPVAVALPADFDAELEQTYKGACPGGPGLGSLANYANPSQLSMPNEQILEFRATEKVLRPDARAYIVGVAQGGQVGAPAKGKMMVSSRGRDAMIGSAKKKSLAMLAFGVLALAGGAVVAILRPGEAKACSEPLHGLVARCAVSSMVVEAERNGKHEKFRRAELKWEVATAGKYQLSAADPHKGKAVFPTVQVENQVGLPMNVGLSSGFGDSAWSFVTTTKNLDPGTYTIMVFSNENAPSKLDLTIAAP